VSLILEVKEGRLAGRQIAVREGRVVMIGRAADRADFAVSHDNFMSSVHFSVECGREGGCLKDRKSSNGTFLNGARITEATLADGDEIRSGRTVFIVRVVAEEPQLGLKAPAVPVPKQAASVSPPVVEAAPPVAKEAEPERISPFPRSAPVVAEVAAKQAAPAATSQPVAAAAPAATQPVTPSAPAGLPLVTIGSWSFAKVPEGWHAQGEFGIQRAEKDAFPSNVVATEEMLGLATLERYVEAQVAMLRQYLREPRIEASLPPAIAGSEETVAIDIRYATKDGQVIVLRRIFARSARRVGVLTLTTIEKDLEEIRLALDAILASVSFRPPD
jgi:predicted component of type VI protein secretion system